MTKAKAWTVSQRDVLDLAACGEAVHFATFFAEKTADSPSPSSSPQRPGTATSVISASAATSDDVVKYADKFGYTALHVAATHGHYVICELLLQNGADVNAKTAASVTPLHCAAEQGHVRIVDLLLKANADPTVYTDRYELPLALARASYHSEVAVMLEPLVTSKTTSEDALVATATGDMVYLLLARLRADGGTDQFGLTTDSGDTPLHVACKVGKFEASHMAVVEFLVSQKLVDVNTANGQRMTALMYATRSTNMELVRLLLRYGADATLSSDPADASRTALSYTSNDRLRVLLDEAERRCEFERVYATRNQIRFNDRPDFITDINALRTRWDEAKENHRVYCADSNIEYVPA